MKIIDGAKHWPHQEMPDEFNAILLKFLVGRRASLSTNSAGGKSSTSLTSGKGILGRMIGAVTSTTKIGNYVLDTMHQKSNETT